jgi:hypothetical protein
MYKLNNSRKDLVAGGRRFSVGLPTHRETARAVRKPSPASMSCRPGDYFIVSS